MPEKDDRTLVHRVIYEELVNGEVHDKSRGAYLDIIDGLVDSGAEGIIAGCTEIELLVGPDDVELPYYRTTKIHTLAAVDWMLGG